MIISEFSHQEKNYPNIKPLLIEIQTTPPRSSLSKEVNLMKPLNSNANLPKVRGTAEHVNTTTRIQSAKCRLFETLQDTRPNFFNNNSNKTTKTTNLQGQKEFERNLLSKEI